MSADQPLNPYAVSLPPGSATTNKSIGRGGEAFATEIHGKYYTATYYGRTYSFNRSAVTVPVIAATLVSVFSVYNPPTSSVNAELVDFDAGVVLVTLVVNTIGLYWSTPTLAALGTLTTIAVFSGINSATWFPGFLGGSAGQVTPYTAYTHSGTPVRIGILGQYGAVTSLNDTPMHYDFDGKIVLPPGHVVSVAMSTAAGDTAGTDLGIRWIEVSTT